MKKGYILVFLTALISGFAIFINKFGVKVFNPDIYTFLKVLTVAIFLTGSFFFFKDWQKIKRLTRKQWLFLIIIGLVGGSAPFLLFFRGLSLTVAAKGAFIHKTMFIWVAFLAAIFLKEKIGKKFLLGGLFLLLGSLILLRKIPYSFEQGDLFVFSATLLWAAENVISKYTLKDLEARIVAWGRMFFGSFFISIFLLATHQLSLVSGINLIQISWILITAVILFGYIMTWYSGLRLVPVSRATVILLLGSPITTILSFIQTGQLSFRAVLASLFIISGIVLIFGIKETGKFFKKIKKLAYVRT